MATTTTEAVRAALCLVEAFRVPISVGGIELFATASVGVAIVIATEASDAGDLVREADTAMYAAKEAGRDRMSVFNENLRATVSARLAVETDLRHALERGQLAVWYQPEVDLATGAVIAVEALLRWHHPDGTVWNADRFIDVAEDTGLILDIGDWVLHQACTQGAAWAAARPDRPITVQVNASALQLANAGLPNAIDDALTASGLDPTLLCMEITETALLRQSATTSNNLTSIHNRGIGIAIDDFGTGYASLTYLSQYPIDIIKIDRSFVTDTTSPGHRLVSGVIALAANINVTVAAEGVEHPEQAARLHAMGCPSAQGWLYSKALPPEDIAPLLDHTYPAPDQMARYVSPGTKTVPTRTSGPSFGLASR
ncbi:MAG: bifunctional diguanylate cyclase/phosphodiesterase [Actinomycetes bacterium]